MRRAVLGLLALVGIACSAHVVDHEGAGTTGAGGAAGAGGTASTGGAAGAGGTASTGGAASAGGAGSCASMDAGAMQPVPCGSMTCGPGEYCLAPCSGIDAGQDLHQCRPIPAACACGIVSCGCAGDPCGIEGAQCEAMPDARTLVCVGCA